MTMISIKMANADSDFSSGHENQQPPNPVQTRLTTRQALESVAVYAGKWKGNDTLPVLFFRALCHLSLEHFDAAADGFTSLDIVQKLGELRGRSWSSTTDKDKMSKDVRNQWPALEALWLTKAEGIAQHLAEKFGPQIPKPRRSEGGGTGRMTRYSLEWINLPSEAQAEQPIAQPLEIGNGAIDIRFVCEDIEDAGFLARIFANGFALSGWRKHAFFGAVFAPLLLCYGLFVVILFGAALSRGLDLEATIVQVMMFLITFLAIHRAIAPLYAVVSKKVVLAPWWMQSTDNDRLLEHRKPPRHQINSINAVRYTAECPICKGRVSTQSGGLAFYGRLVGRCEQAPVEHVFSFDHMTRQGKCLR